MNIKTIVALPIAILAGIAFVLSLSIVTTLSTSAAESKTETKKVETKSQPKASTAAAYTYVAQSGDSYTKLARKAIQTYGITNKISLSQSRIVFAETNLTQEAKSPELVKGQKVTISEATVKNWVEKAKKLSNQDAAKWDKYTAGVNFDTRTVGEAR